MASIYFLQMHLLWLPQISLSTISTTPILYIFILPCLILLSPFTSFSSDCSLTQSIPVSERSSAVILPFPLPITSRWNTHQVSCMKQTGKRVIELSFYRRPAGISVHVAQLILCLRFLFKKSSPFDYQYSSCPMLLCDISFPLPSMLPNR